MKIQKIKVSSFRGIPNDFERELNYESMVIEGDNGTGKSGLIDAVDFLLTGKIKRLSGEGTGNISQEQYGHHIDKTSEDAKVEAIVKFKGKPLVIERKLSQPTKLKRIKGEEKFFDNLNIFLETGQFSLSRRELLKFIICTDQDRSKAIQELLDISEIEKVRKAIDQSYKLQKDEKDKLQDEINTDISSLKQDLKLSPSSDFNNIRDRINEYREKLKAEKITQWDQSPNILKGIHFEKVFSNSSLTKDKFERSTHFLMKKNESLKEEKTKLAKIINKILKTESFEKLTKTNDLVRLGMTLLTDDTCPLCDTEWKDRDLIGYLKSKLKEANDAIQLKKDFEHISLKLVSFLEKYVSDFQYVISESRRLTDESGALIKELETSITFIRNRIKLYKDIFNSKELLSKIENETNIIDLPNWDTLGKIVSAFAKKLPEESKEQKIYQALTSAKNKRENIKKCETKIKLQTNKINLVKKINQNFENRKDSFFKDLYREIENDFIVYYKYLNKDELNFSANIEDQKGSVGLTVDFYERGKHPPHALHSEGHQDSMGICLFLALMKKIKGKDFSIALLDDVMMSVDIGHRRKLAQLLKDQFPETQFLITTHDSIWAKELRRLQIVSKNNMLKFSNWSPDGGPSYRLNDPWIQCKNYNEQGEINLAGKILREALEGEFQRFCTHLRAMVPFNSDAKWALGELLSGALEAFKRYIKRAKDIAITSKNENNLKDIEKIENMFKTAQQEADIDQWIINPMNHYNEKANFSKEEGRNVIEKMKKFCEAFSYNGDPFIISFDNNRKPVAFTTLHSSICFSLIKNH